MNNLEKLNPEIPKKLNGQIVNRLGAIAAVNTISLTEAPVQAEMTRNQKLEAETSLVSFMEFSKFNKNFKKLSPYLDGDEISFVNSLDSKYDQDKKNDILMQVYDRVNRRFENNTRPDTYCEYDQKKEFSRTINREYAMQFNDYIRSYICNPDNKTLTMGQMSQKLNSTYLLIAKPESKYRNINTNNRYDKQEVFVGVSEVLNGMRHEIAFKELYRDIDCISFDPDEYSREDDMKGIDIRLTVKLSKQFDENGNYKYPDKNELKKGDYIEKELPVDLKSSQHRAVEKLSENKNQTEYAVNNWVLWSHINSIDFCFGYQRKLAKPIAKDINDAPLFMSQDQQVAFIKNLGGRSFKLVDSFAIAHAGEQCYIESYENRVRDIKSKVLEGINYIYSAENLSKKTA